MTSAKAGLGQQDVMTTLSIYSICGERKYDNTLNDRHYNNTNVFYAMSIDFACESDFVMRKVTKLTETRMLPSALKER